MADSKTEANAKDNISVNSLQVKSYLRMYDTSRSTYPRKYKIEVNGNNVIINHENNKSISSAEARVNNGVTFDGVFKHQSTKEICETALESDFIKSVDGYTTTVIGYGIKRSGKTNTVFGDKWKSKYKIFLKIFSFIT